MITLTAHARFALLVEADFDGWQLGVSRARERRMVRWPDWCCYAAALASLSGGLDDLQERCSDDELLELVRHGLSLFCIGIVSSSQLMAEHDAVLSEVLAWGDAVERELATANN